jgi:hypothetical protein
MNNRYFICKTHKKYTDAGYRWAYWQLEDKGVITLGTEVDVNAVLSEHDYWNPDEADRSEWLCAEILPTARRFLEAHRAEGIEYADEEFLYVQWELGYEWREVVSTKNGEQAAP